MKNEDLHNSANIIGSKEERKARERGRAVNKDGERTVGGVISGCRRDVRQGADGVREDCVMVNGSPDSSSSPRSDESECCAREARNINRVWEEGEVEICVGTLDEEFLVGRRGKDKNVIPGTGFGALVAHPEGTVLWGENDIVGVTDAVTGVRWKYGVTAGVRLPFHRDH